MAHTAYRLLVALVLLAGGAIAAYEPLLDNRALDEAVAIGQSRIETRRIRFHQTYRLPVGRGPVDSVDLVTPFRRVVLAAEAGARAGDRIFSQREARAAVNDGNRIDLVVELTFHPLNVLVTMPSYTVTLTAAGIPIIHPRAVEQTPRYGPRIDGVPSPGGAPAAPGSQPMLGGTVTSQFDGRLLRPNGVYDAVISEAGKELARASVDLGKLR